jgi:hypothetical protein
MGTPEIVVKRARPLSSMFEPVAAPMGFSGDFSSDGKSVFSAHRFSESEGCRSSVTSEIGLSETWLLETDEDSFSAMYAPL